MIKRLESLELQGFKTFATITRLEFPGTITAIVGPNGSGKSNIADSVRWVLGEQAFSLLRAKKTEDMIFSGSQQRSRAGMASTTITFNNEDGWLPIDYSEVSISRRAYRDGQNEYLLNGQKVRLRDISEVLSQTGLSERTYTIIGQGLVDVALALKPDERRKLFEEAAGIGLYRSRKEESLRRLEDTRKNLERILDIMTEIRPRLRSLERQAGRFEEYQRLRSDLEVYLREWYGYHWHQKQQNLRLIRSDFQDQEKRLNTLREKYSQAENKVEEARQKLILNRKELEKAHSELSKYHRQLEIATRELAIVDERKRSYNHQKGDLEIDITHVQEEIKELASQDQNYHEEIDRRQREYMAAVDEVNQAENQLSTIAAKKEARQTELENARHTRINLEKDRVQSTARLEELGHRIESLVKEKGKIEQSIQDLNDERSSIKQSVGQLTKFSQKAQQAFSELQNNLESRSHQLNGLRDKKQQIDQSIAREETKQAKLSAQLDVLTQAEAALSGYSEGSKSVVEDSRVGRLPKGIEPLTKHIIVEEKFERAISAALGELTDLLIMPSGASDVVIEYLEGKENGRVALVSVDQAKPIKVSKMILETEGVFGFANDLIQVDDKYRGLIDKLFTDILIVQDRRTAQRIQSDLVATQKAVTLKGLVFQANGVMISGQSATGKRIGRIRQQNELAQELSQVGHEITRLEEQKTHFVQSIQEMHADHDALLNEVKSKEAEKNKANQKHQEAQDRLTRLNEQLTWHQDRLESIQENIIEGQTQRDAIESLLDDMVAQIDNILEEERTCLAKLNALPFFEMQQELNHWETHQIVTKNALEAARQRYHDHHDRLEGARARLDTYQSRLADLENGLIAIQEKEANLKAEEAEIKSSIQEMQNEQINPLTSLNEELEKSVSALEKLEAHSHKQVIIAERHFTQLQLELSRREDQLNNLHERIVDDFGLVSFEYENRMEGPTPLPFEDGLIKELPRVQTLSTSIDKDIKRLKSQIRRIGAINPEAQQEYYEVKERFEFLTSQIDDLRKASQDLKEVIERLDQLMEQDFIETFKSVDKEFSEYFSRLFNGGEAKLLFVDDDNPVEGGVEIEARLPGRRSQGLALLSGGERSLTAVALIFALLKVSPTPFCILDEVDAMLDESNVGRFIELLRELAKKTQFVIITHNRNTVQAADVIYGVTMGRDSTSQMISLKLEDVDDTYLE